MGDKVLMVDDAELETIHNLTIDFLEADVRGDFEGRIIDTTPADYPDLDPPIAERVLGLAKKCVKLLGWQL